MINILKNRLDKIPVFMYDNNRCEGICLIRMTLTRTTIASFG